MNAAEIAEQAITKMELEEQGHVVEEKPAENAGKDESGAGKDAGKPETHGDREESAKDSGDKADDKGKDDGKPAADEAEKDEEGKYTADDALEVDEEAEPDAPATDAAGVQLSTAEQKYIVENIGDPLALRGYAGEGENRKEVEIKAYTVGDIPANFNFRSQAELLAAQTGFLKLEQKAEQLLGQFRNNQSETQARDFEHRENEGIRLDVSELQQEGEFPKFKIQPGQKGFDDDPAAKLMGEVLGIMTDRNNTYLQQYQQGRPYRHIGFREAYEIYQHQQGPKQQAEAQKKEDAERKQVADKIGTDRAVSQSKIAKPRVRSGTTVNDILARYEGEEW